MSVLEAMKLKGVSQAPPPHVFFFSRNQKISVENKRRLVLYDRNFKIDEAKLRSNQCRLFYGNPGFGEREDGRKCDYMTLQRIRRSRRIAIFSLRDTSVLELK